MSGLGRILKQEGGVATSFGPGQASALTKRLRGYKGTLQATFWIFFLVLVLLIMLGAYGLWHYLLTGSSSDAVAFAGAVGLAGGSASIVEILRRVWTEWARTALVVVLITDAPEAVINEVVARLVEKLT